MIDFDLGIRGERVGFQREREEERGAVSGNKSFYNESDFRLIEMFFSKAEDSRTISQ